MTSTVSRTHLPVLPALMVEDAVRAALLEDWGRAGDITARRRFRPNIGQPPSLRRASRDGLPVSIWPKPPSALAIPRSGPRNSCRTAQGLRPAMS